MRIVCQKCSAAYAIDDKFVTDKGVRAQCPRCRHLQLVKKGDLAAPAAIASPVAEPAPGPAAPGPAAPGPSPFVFDVPGLPPAQVPARVAAPAPKTVVPTPLPFAFDFAAPGAPPTGAPAPRSPFDFDLAAPLPPPPAPARSTDFPGSPPRSPAPSFAAPDASSFAPLGGPFVPAAGPFAPAGGPFAPAPAHGPFAAPPASEPPGFEFGSPAPGAPTNEAFTNEAFTNEAFTNEAFDALTGSGAGGFGAAPLSTATCKSCGKAISDPFDVALGTCDECRSKQQEQVDGPTPDTNAGKSERVDVAAIASSRSGQGRAGELPPTASGQAPLSVAQTNAVRSAVRAQESSSRVRTVAGLLVVVLVLGGVGGVLYVKKPWVRRPPRLTTTTTVAPVTAKPIDGLVQKWKLNFPDLGDEDASQAKVHVEAGEAFLAKDTTRGYRDAEEEFQKALVLDSSSDQAIAGWVLSVAFGRNGEVDDATSKAAEAMLQAAEQRSGAPLLYVAHAHLDIARGVNVNDIQHHAEIGKNGFEPREKALAALAIGQAQLGKNAQTAEQSFKEALTLDPRLRRAYLFQARLAISLGKYREAADAFEKRLSLDADQWEAAESLARLYVEVGELARARKVLEGARVASPKNPRVRLAQGVLAYQHAGDLPGAVELFNGLISDRDVSKKDQADALAHLAAIQRVQGDLDKAMASTERALDLQPDHLAAKLQQLLVLTDKGITSQARLTVDSLKGKLPAALESSVEGRVLVAENRLDDAVTVLTALADRDPSQTGALLLASAAAARSRKDGKAWELCLKRGLKVEPLSNPLPAMTTLYVRQADLLKPALGAWLALTSGSDEDPNPFLCEGLASWYSEDLVSAEKQFARVTNIDPGNPEGYAFRALVALKKKDVGTAVTHAGKAVNGDKQNALANYTSALAMVAANKLEAAKIAAVTANKLGPSLVGPRVIMGDLDARQGNKDEGRRLLTGVLLADPQFREAKRALFKQAL